MSEETKGPAPHPTALRMQILTTEHWSLLSSRGLAWSESFSRAAMYLSTLSGAMVALGLVAGIDRLGHAFIVFALVVLPVVLFVGLATLVRMGSINYHDAIAIAGMNRIRGAYIELAPDLEAYFVMGTHDDPPGIARTMAVPPNLPPLLHVISATPFVVTVLNAVVAGAITAVLGAGVLGIDVGATLGLALAALLATIAVQVGVVASNMRRGRDSFRPMFPTQPSDRPRKES